VEAHGEADVEAHGEADVEAHGEADVEAHGEADVEAHGEADVEAHGEADVEAHGEAGAEAAHHVETDAHVDVDSTGHVPGGATPHTGSYGQIGGAGYKDTTPESGIGPEHLENLKLRKKPMGVRRPGFWKTLLVFLGVGKVPLSIALMTFLALFGLIGFTSNCILRPVLRFPIIFFWISFAAAFIASGLLTNTLSRSLSRLLPTTETYVIGKSDLVGRIGKATTKIDDSYGACLVKDDSGTVHQLGCRTKPPEVIELGMAVLVVYYDSVQKYYQVTKAPDELTQDSV
jgi:membrane protein implicated in regulation of membrane protease activity